MKSNRSMNSAKHYFHHRKHRLAFKSNQLLSWLDSLLDHLCRHKTVLLIGLITIWGITPTLATAPTVSSLFPEHNYNRASQTDHEYIITFSEEVVPNAAGVTIRLMAFSSPGNYFEKATASTATDLTASAGNTSFSIDFGLTTPLSNGGIYYIEIPSGAFEDLEGNDFAGTGESSWYFQVNQAPTYVGLVGNEVYDAAADGTEVGYFYTTDPNAGDTFTYTLVSGTGDTHNSYFRIVDGDLLTNGDWSSLTIPDPLSIRVQSTDADGETVSSSFSITPIADPFPPEIVSTTPANGATGVDIFSDLVITFNEPVVSNGGTLYLRRYSNNAEKTSISFNDPGVIINDEVVTIDLPDEDLWVLNTQYYVHISTNALVDTAGNYFAGFSDKTIWNFTSEEATPPGVSSYSPALDATDVAVDQTFTLTFDEPVVKRTVYIKLSYMNHTAFEEFFSEDVTVSGNEVSFTPSTDLPTGTEMYISVSSLSFADLKGGYFPGVGVGDWSFTTAGVLDTDAPVITSLSPADDATNVAVDANLVIQFDEVVELPVTGNTELIRIRKADGTNVETFLLPSAKVTGYGTSTITINPTNDLTDDESYYVQFFDAFEDELGNMMASMTTTDAWNFSTGEPDITGPSVTGFISPTDNETDVEPDENIVIEFSEPIVKGSGNVTIKVNGTITHETIAIGSSQITISGSQLTIDPTDPIFHGRTVSISIDAGALEDAAGNPSSSLLINDLVFTIRDPYEQTAVSPVDGASDVAIDTDITMTFDGPIFKTNSAVAGDRIQIINVTDGITTNIPANSSQISVSGNVVTINPDVDLLYEKEYRIYVFNSTNGVFEDEFGFSVGHIGISVPIPDAIDNNGDDAWTFTTEEDPALDVPSLVAPADAATDVSITPTMTWTAVSGATRYTLRITEQGEIDPVYEGGSITGTSFNLGTELEDPLLYETTYVWKMKAHDSKNESEWSEESSFTTEAAPIATPQLVSPTDAAVDVDVTITLEWNAVTDADEYHLYVSDADENYEEEVEDIIGTSYEISGLEYSTEYTWTVRALDNSAGYSEWSEIWSFTTRAEPEPLDLPVLTFPADGATDVSITPTLTWNAVTGANDYTIQVGDQSGPFLDENVSGTSYMLSGLDSETEYSWRVMAHGDDGDSEWTDIWTFTTEAATNTWNGTSWSMGAPAASENVLFTSDYSFSNDEILEVNDLTTANGVVFNIESGATLIVNGNLDANGLFTVESGASLITFEGNTVDGNVRVRRNASFGSTDNSIGKYSFVSLPVTGTGNLINKLGNRVYSYNEAQETNEVNGYGYTLMNGLAVIDQGKGYAATFSPEVFEFIGKPTVGTITEYVNTSQNSGFHLVGNPYSAALDVDEFFSDNASVSSIAIWDDGGASGGAQQSGAFIQVNELGSVTATSNLNSNTFNGYIGTAQGFFVETAGNLSITFQEDQRVSGDNNDDHFFRKSASHAIKLSLGDGQVQKQTLIAFDEEATNGLDLQKDATLRKSGLPVELYSLVEESALAIQAIAPADEALIPLGYEVTETGVFTISPVELVGFGKYAVELVDHELKRTITLEHGVEYSFTSLKGIFNERFDLRFTSRVLAVGKEEVQVYAHEHTIHINLPEGMERDFQLMSLDGQRLLSRKLSRSAQIQTNLPAGVYIVTDGEQSHKIILK